MSIELTASEDHAVDEYEQALERLREIDEARVRLFARDLVVKLQIPEPQAERARDIAEASVLELLAERERAAKETV